MNYAPGHEPEGPDDHNWELTMTVTWTMTVAAPDEDAALQKLWSIEATELNYVAPAGAEEEYSSDLEDMGPSHTEWEKSQYFPVEEK